MPMSLRGPCFSFTGCDRQNFDSVHLNIRLMYYNIILIIIITRHCYCMALLLTCILFCIQSCHDTISFLSHTSMIPYLLYQSCHVTHVMSHIINSYSSKYSLHKLLYNSFYETEPKFFQCHLEAHAFL